MRRFLVVLFFMFVLSGCYYASQIPTAPTPVGRKNYIESIKRIDAQKKATEKRHKKEKQRIKKLQQLDRDVQDR